MAKRFASRHVRQVDFYHRQTRSDNGIPKAHRCVGQSARIQEHDISGARSRFMQLVNESTFVIGLLTADLYSPLLSPTCESLIKLGQSEGAVDIRLTAAKQIQVRPM